MFFVTHCYFKAAGGACWPQMESLFDHNMAKSNAKLAELLKAASAAATKVIPQLISRRTMHISMFEGSIPAFVAQTSVS
jgi:hypothetical protein